MTQACVPVIVGGQNCVSCPEVIAVAGVPEQIINDPRVGWNTSAYSRALLPGPCYTQFSMPAGIYGCAVGVTTARTSNDPRRLPHAIFVLQEAGVQWWTVYEMGVEKIPRERRFPETDLFRIERRGTQITYLHNGRRVYESTQPAAPEGLCVVACMYAAPDGVN